MFTRSLDDGAELARLEPWHADQFLETLAGSRDHLAASIPAASCIFTLDDARKYLQAWAEGHARDSMHLFGMWLDGTLVGCVQLFAFNTAIQTCEIGVWITKDAQGRSLVTTACRYLIDWAIRRRGMVRLQWTNNPRNERSSAVARRLGMTREGVLRSAGVLASAPLGLVNAAMRWDNEVWSVLADEWPTLEQAQSS